MLLWLATLGTGNPGGSCAIRGDTWCRRAAAAAGTAGRQAVLLFSVLWKQRQRGRGGTAPRFQAPTILNGSVVLANSLTEASKCLCFFNCRVGLRLLAMKEVHDEDLLLLLLLLQWLWREPHYLVMAFTHLSERSLP